MAMVNGQSREISLKVLFSVELCPVGVMFQLYRLSIVSRAANCHGAIQVSSEALCERRSRCRGTFYERAAEKRENAFETSLSQSDVGEGQETLASIEPNRRRIDISGAPTLSVPSRLQCTAVEESSTIFKATLPRSINLSSSARRSHEIIIRKVNWSFLSPRRNFRARHFDCLQMAHGTAEVNSHDDLCTAETKKKSSDPLVRSDLSMKLSWKAENGGASSTLLEALEAGCSVMRRSALGMR